LIASSIAAPVPAIVNWFATSVNTGDRSVDCALAYDIAGLDAMFLSLS
jgi:hypothetical protein